MMMLAIGLCLTAVNVAVGVRCYLLLRKVTALDILLADICTRAFILRAGQIWQPWTDTMGRISVQVHAEREEWGQ